MRLDDEDFDEGMIEALEEVKQSLITGEPLHHLASFDQQVVDVPELRARYGMTQQAFADGLGISVGTLRGWEQGRRRPDGPARRLLQILEEYPQVAAELLSLKQDKARADTGEAGTLYRGADGRYYLVAPADDGSLASEIVEQKSAGETGRDGDELVLRKSQSGIKARAMMQSRAQLLSRGQLNARASAISGHDGRSQPDEG